MQETLGAEKAFASSTALRLFSDFKQAFEVVDMRGWIPASTTSPKGYYVRVLTANDVFACDNLHQSATGYSRKNRLLHSLKSALPKFVVQRDDEDGTRRVVGFTTGFHLSGFSVAESEDAMKALITIYSQCYEHMRSKKEDGGEDGGAAAADDKHKSEGPSVVVQVPTRHASLLKWLTEQGLKKHSHRTVLVSGKAEDDKQIYFPSFQF